MTDAAGLISYLGTWVQLGGILLLLTLFRLLSRHAGTRSYFVIWAQAWLVLLVAVTAILLRYFLASGLSPALLAEKSPLATLLYLLYQSAKLLHLGLLVPVRSNLPRAGTPRGTGCRGQQPSGFMQLRR